MPFERKAFLFRPYISPYICILKYAAPDSYAVFTNKKSITFLINVFPKQILIEDKMNREMLKEAIAEAKTIKETAIASAKAALEEAFTPQLTAMFAEKLNEMDEMDKEVTEEMQDENYGMEEEGLEEDFNLEEILAELGEGDDEKMEEGIFEADEDDMGKDMDIADEDLEAMIKDILSQMLTDKIDAGEIEAGENFEKGDDEVDADDMDMDVDTEVDMDMPDGEEKEEEEEISLEELLAEIDSLSGLNEGKKKAKKEDKKKEEKKDEKEEELKEAYSAIAELKAELNEVNLLNAKLLYTNKIFKAKNLTESEKVKVLNTFDKAETVKEVKLVFETLTESFKATAKKNPIKESLGSASRTVVAAPKQEQIIEVNDAFARMQRLAGLRK
jgi:hypothetical protein